MITVTAIGERTGRRAKRLISAIPWAIAALPGLLTAAQADELGWQAKGTNGVVVAGRTGSAEAARGRSRASCRRANAAANNLAMLRLNR
jgi:hypothetical protein